MTQVNKMTVVYRGYTIVYSEYQWIVYNEADDKMGEYETQKLAETYIDNRIERLEKKNQKKFEKVAAFKIENNPLEITDGFITSVCDKGVWGGQDVWFSSNQGKREKIGIQHAYFDTPSNRARAAACVQLYKEVKAKEQEMDIIIEQMERLKVEND